MSTRCLIYARCSTKDQENENQVAQLKEYARRQDWLVVDTVVDVCSGGKSADERNGLNSVFGRARKREFDILLFWALDRFSREGSRKTLSYLSILDDCRTGWHSFTEPYFSTLGVFRDAIIAILSALAKQEKIRISERTKAGLERTVRVNGTRLGRPRLADAVVQNSLALRSQGHSYSEIGKTLGVTKARAFQIIKEARKLCVVGQPQPAR